MVSLQSKIDSLSEGLVVNEEENVETEPVSTVLGSIDDDDDDGDGDGDEEQNMDTKAAINGHAVKSGDSMSSYGSSSSAGRRRAASVEWPPRKQPRTVETVEVGCLNVISANYESLDYDVPDCDLILDEERTNGLKYERKKNIYRWLVFMFIGVFTASVGAILDICIDKLSEVKYGTLKHYVDQCVERNCLYFPYLMWVALNVIFVLVGSVLVTYVEPVAAGSGIPQVKCYLNGVKIPRVVRIKTLLVKVIGVISSVVGGLAVGKEGPMIHSGAVVAAGISQGKSTSLGKDFKCLHFFREDHEKRDFVSGGAAAGVAAAFGSPVGGVLFSLEEGTSFWNQSLTWRVFLSAMVSTFTLNGILSMYHGDQGQLKYAGLLSLGKFPDVSYYWFELIIYMLMGLVGGLFGCLFNFINYHITVFRMRYINNKLWMKVIEACLVAAATATVGFAMIFFLNDCRPLGQDPTKYPIQVFCGDGEYNALGALWFQTPESSVKSLFQDPAGSHKATSLSLFFVVYFLLSIWTYGLSVSAGLFIPSLLTGAAWGRLMGMALMWMFPDEIWVDLRKYALIGAAAQLGGTVRMTISLTVILIEATGNIAFGLPLMITLICAKWMGDFFNEGIYDIHIMLSGVPLLPWEPPPLSHDVYASEIMSHPVVVLRSVERVYRIVQILRNETHNGFPVVDPGHKHQSDTIAFGKLRGLILRHQLIVLLQNKIFNEREELWSSKNHDVSLKIFRDMYPRYKDIQDISLSYREMGFTVDLRPYMNSSPYAVIHSMTLPRVFRLFRALGIRHLPVIDDTNQVVGMVTRKDLVRYRANYHGGKMTREELKISENI